MSLKARLPAQPFALPKGFSFAPRTLREFAHEAVFRKALHEQAASTELIDAAGFESIDADGNLLDFPYGGQTLRLTKTAFGHICHICKLPASYVEALAKRDESLALSVVSEALHSMLHRVQNKMMVVDTRVGVIEAVVDREGYNLVTNEQVLDLALSAGKNARMTRGFLEGPNVRITVVNPSRFVEPKVGDVVRFGTDLATNLGSENIVVTQVYNERMKCLNGMVGREQGQVERLSARTDVSDALPEAIMRAVDRGERLGPMMKVAARKVLDENAIDRMTAYLQAPENGGNRTLLQNVVQGAQREARDDLRDEGELTVWDFVNGVTDAAKSAKSLNRRVEIEALGYRLMAAFTKAA